MKYTNKLRPLTEITEEDITFLMGEPRADWKKLKNAFAQAGAYTPQFTFKLLSRGFDIFVGPSAFQTEFKEEYGL